MEKVQVNTQMYEAPIQKTLKAPTEAHEGQPQAERRAHSEALP